MLKKISMTFEMSMSGNQGKVDVISSSVVRDYLACLT